MNAEEVRRRIRVCDYLTVAQLFLKNNFLLEEKLTFDDIKPRLLGHWGTCHGINIAYANLLAFFSERKKIKQPRDQITQSKNDLLSSIHSLDDQRAKARPETETKIVTDPDFSFILGPGHGFPALQANLFIDGELEKVDPQAARTLAGISYICKNFSWPGGFPSHASPFTPGVICEGGELGYAFGAAYGYCMGHPEKTVAVLLGDGEFETATTLASMNLVKLLGNHAYNGRILPILHLNGYKISAPTLYARKSEHELGELIRGFGYTPITIDGGEPEAFQRALTAAMSVKHPFLILRTEKGATGPTELHGKKVAGNFLAHQIPLPAAKTDPEELSILSNWLKSYNFPELFDPERGFVYLNLKGNAS